MPKIVKLYSPTFAQNLLGLKYQNLKVLLKNDIIPYTKLSDKCIAFTKSQLQVLHYYITHKKKYITQKSTIICDK